MNKIAVGLFALALAGLGGLYCAAQDRDDSQETFRDTIEVRVYSVEVYVEDSDGNPVEGLTAADFQLFADGEWVEITHFYAPRTISRPFSALPQDPEEQAQLTAGTFTQPPDGDLRMVILLDRTRLHPQGRDKALQYIERFVDEQLPDNLEVMLVDYDGSLNIHQGFTADRYLLKERLASYGTAVADVSLAEERNILAGIQNYRTEEYFDRELGTNTQVTIAERTLREIDAYAQTEVVRRRQGLADLKQFVGSLSGLPGRKAVLIVSDETNMVIGEHLYQIWAETFRHSAQRMWPRVTSQASQNSLTDSIIELVRHANTHQVTVYTLNTASDRSFSESLAEAEGTAFPSFSSPWTLPDSGEALTSLALGTGGYALRNNEKLSEQLGKISVELASYYSIGFQPQPESEADYRKIKVKALKDALKLRYREGLSTLSGDDRFAARTVAAMVLGVTDNPLDMSVEIGDQTAAEENSFRVPVKISIPMDTLALLPKDDRFECKITLLVAGKDAYGRQIPVQRREASVTVPEDDMPDALDEDALFTLNLVLDPGEKRLGIGVRDENGKVDSTAFVDIEVGTPDEHSGSP
jgi:VWFA-related protein